MKSRNYAIVAITTGLLLATIAAVSITTPDNAFAYKKNQAGLQTNACGNGEIPTNVGCQNTDSQTQGDENAAALTAQQTFPEVKLAQEEPPAIPPQDQPLTCEECLLVGLTVEEGLATKVAIDLGLGTHFDNDSDAVKAICHALDLRYSEGEVPGARPIDGVIASILDNVPNTGFWQWRVGQILPCLDRAFLGS